MPSWRKLPRAEISVIIPTRNEEQALPGTFHNLLGQEGNFEVILVDGGSSDGTYEIAERWREVFRGSGRRLVVRVSEPGRAVQMNLGAEEAEGDVFLFLHADTQLPSSAQKNIRSALEEPRCVGGRFDISLDGEEWIYRLIGKLISLRSRMTRVATGDQAIFVRRKIFEDIGGFPDIPLMEDIAFSRVLKSKGSVACLKNKVVTSARRWKNEGIWRTILKMWALRLSFLAGISPLRLKRFYDDSR